MMVVPSLLLHTTRSSTAVIFQQSRRRCILSSISASQSSTQHDVHHQQHSTHHHRSISTNTRPLSAQPHKYVMGVTDEQMAQTQALKDWYRANFPDWQEEPDKVTPAILAEIEEAQKSEDEDDKDKVEVAVVEEEENPSIIKLPEHLTKRNIRPLVAYLREPGIEEGSRNCNKLRNPGVNDPNLPLIPGIIHGSDPTKNIVSVDASSKVMVKVPWFEIQCELDRYHYGVNGSFENRVYALTVFPSNEAHLDHHRTRHPKDRTTYKVDDEKMEIVAIPAPPLPTPPPRTAVEGMENLLVIPSDLQLHPIQHTTYCLNFIRYHPNKPIKIPIRRINEEESPAIKRGGFLLMTNRFIECLVDAEAPIPECIDLECTGLRQKDVVRRERLIIPEGVTVHPRVADNYLIGTVYGSRGSADDESETSEEEK